jgi:hypothetical protein
MWRIYSPNQLGVRIKTTRTLLTNELQKAFPDKDRYYWMLGNVSYISQAEIEKRLTLLVERLRAKHKPTKALAPLLWKRRAFVHEAEIRAVVYDRQAQKPITEVKVPVDAHWLVQSVLIDPRAPPEIVDMYTHYLRTKLKYKRRVRQSELYAKRPPHPTTAE